MKNLIILNGSWNAPYIQILSFQKQKYALCWFGAWSGMGDETGEGPKWKTAATPLERQDAIALAFW